MATTPAYGAGGTTQPDQFPTLDQSASNPTSQELTTLNNGMSQAQFMAMTGVTSTELPTYMTGASLNNKAYALVQYFAMDPETRQAFQQDMIDAGLLAAGKATGLVSDGLTAYKTAINVAGSTGQPVVQYLDNAVQNGIAAAQETGLTETAAANKSLENPAPITVSLENPTTLTADQQAAWNQTLGYAADPAQIAQFIAQIHAQDTQYAEAGNDATKANDEQVIANVKSADSQLNALGQDGVTMFASLYQKALGQPAVPPSTTGVPGHPTLAPEALRAQMSGGRGPQLTPPGGTPTTGASPTPPAVGAQGIVPDVLNAGNAGLRAVGAAGAATENAAKGIPGTIGTALNAVGQAGAATGRAVQGIPGALNAAGTGLENLIGGWLFPPSPQQADADAQRALAGKSNKPGAPGAPAPMTGGRPESNVPAGIAPTPSGLYNLTPQLWQEALAAYPNGSALQAQYPTEGSAPIAIQQGAFAALAVRLYQTTAAQSWANVTEILLTGNTTGKPTATEQKYANSINAQINSDISTIQSSLNNQPAIKETVTAPDAQAEAAAAAKESDPIGYTAANVSSWGGVLQSMLYGNPVASIASLANPFTGPVAPPDASLGGTSAPAPAAAAAANTTAASVGNTNG